MTESELFTTKESAAYRRCSERKQDRERSEGRGPSYVRIDGRIFYRKRDIDDFIEAHIYPGETQRAVQNNTSEQHEQHPVRRSVASRLQPPRLRGESRNQHTAPPPVRKGAGS